MARKKILSDSELAAFCEQLVFMLKSGVSLQEGLMLLSTDENKYGAQVTAELLEFMEQGSPFSGALKQSGRFPGYMVNMAEIGEASGELDSVLDSLRAYYERSEAVSKSIKSAVTYPLVMIVMMLVVILIIIVEVLPVFQNVFVQLGSEMSPIAEGIINFGAAVSQYSVVIGIVVAAVVAFFVILYNTKAGKQWLSGVYEAMFKKTSEAVAAGRFASSMSLMLKSGMDVDSALELSETIITHKGTLKKLARTRAMIDGGKGFAEAIVESGMFTPLYGKMLMIGFKTGTQDQVMERIAQFYQDESERRIGGLIAAIEPTLVAILSVIVGMILLSVMLPLMGVMTAIG